MDGYKKSVAGAIKSSYGGEKEGIKKGSNVGHGIGRRLTTISIKRLWMLMRQKIKNWLQRMLIWGHCYDQCSCRVQEPYPEMDLPSTELPPNLCLRKPQKRHRKKKLKEVASRRRHIIGPQLPSTDDDQIDGEGSNGPEHQQSEGIRRNVAEGPESAQQLAEINSYKN
ncbi:hypothetical protein L6452_33722 [Arctium lappa]|uniref:Uncharacterized protein n=1 Tax=Arctium lappa TaxID=4217 RepID=A0ACB8YH64_ARCLA|nr:hypothetical protein L6452_33722 [Arctium lappa]